MWVNALAPRSARDDFNGHDGPACSRNCPGPVQEAISLVSG